MGEPIKFPAAPYERAADEWDNRWSHMARSLRNWQVAAIGLVVANCVGLVLLYLMATGSRVVPYIVEVDQHGQAVAFGPAERLAFLDERIYRHSLAMWVADLRTVTSDAQIQKRLIERAYAYASGEALATLNSWFADGKRNPFARAREELVRVQVESVLRLDEERWQVQWTERRYGTSGGQELGQEGWQAIVKVERQEPRDTGRILVNPVGLYITAVSWAQRSAPAEGEGS